MDIAITAYLLILSATIAFRLARRFGAQRPGWGQVFVAVCIALAVWLAWTVGSDLRWATIIPHSSVLLLANAFAILAVVAAGLLVGTRCVTVNRQLGIVTALCFTSIWFIGGALFRPILHPLDLPRLAIWEDDVCIQGHESSCSPAAAATLLRQHGVMTTERKMAELSLTSAGGTLSLGTFRGLCVATATSDLHPRAVVYGSPQEAGTFVHQLPMLVHVNFAGSGLTAGLQTARLGQADNLGRHAVVILSKLNDDRWLVADPAIGKTIWTDDYFRRIWVGEGIYLSRD